MSTIPAEDVKSFVDRLRERVVVVAARLSGAEVARAIFALTDEMHDAGVDWAWESAEMVDRKSLCDVFDITWLTMLLCKLDKLL